MRVFIPLNIFILSLLFVLPAMAQDCDCDDSDNCPYAFGPNFTGQVCYDITDALNNDLADPGQGICGVALTFTHQHIWDLELTLISPAGQEVPLVGFNTSFFGTTNNVLWNILFIPCANVPSPDTINNNPFQAVWTNNQSWPFGALFDGSYHPVGGNCLESFNTGPVNGTWCLQIENQPSPYSGEILNFEVILCDNSGLLCCDADAGALEVADFTICEGDSSLQIDWSPDYGPIFPSPAEYGYTFVVSDTAGIILQVDPMPDLTSYAVGEYTVCGLSYLRADSLLLPVPDGVLTLDSLANNLLSGEPWFCGDLTEDCVIIDIVPPPVPVFLVDTICAGESYTVGDSAVAQSGQYLFQLESAFGCDSLVNLDLTVLQPDSTFLVETVCFGEVYPVGDSIFSASGSFSVLLSNAFGCDSLVFLDLTVLPEIETFLTDTICQGAEYALGDSLFVLPGNYEVLLTSALGCDSTVFLDLIVLDPLAQIAAPDTLTCAMPELWLDGTGSSSGPGISYQWTALSGTLSPPLDSNQVLATGPGEYELAVSSFFCTVRDTVIVLADTLAPLALVLPPDTLTCGVDSVLLDGSGTASGFDFLYQWAGPAGIIPGAENAVLWVTTPGAYALIVLDAGNGCADTSTVTVTQDIVAPFVEAGPSSVLNCQDQEALLDGSATYQDGPFVFEWLGPVGDPVPWTDSLQAVVSEPGWYVLWATDPGNACTASDSVLVGLDTIPPVADAGLADTLTCAEPVLSLDGSGGGQSGAVVFFWETPNGNIAGDPAQPDPDVDALGLYILTVTDPVNHCTAVDSVEIFEDTEFPMADAGPTVTLNCLLREWTLGNPDSTSLGPSFSYLWIGPQGDSIATELSPTIQTGGTYVLFVTDQTNGCTSIDSVFIEQEEDFPVAVIDGGGEITCSASEVLLDGSNSTSGPGIEYAWLDTQGNVIGTDNQLTAGNTGVYCLVVENGFNFCRDTACVEVLQGPGFPLVDAGPNEVIDCATGQAFPQGSVQPLNPAYALTWSTLSGNILSDPTQLAIIVDEPGWYTFTVDDTVNNCLVVDSAFVLLDTAACLPLVNAGADGLINCYHLPLLYDTLDASQGTSTGPEIVYQWTSIGGTVVIGENTLFPVVTEGTFILTVTNTLLNLSATDTVVVYEDLVPPLAHAGLNDTIDCSTINMDYYLDGSGSSQGSQYVYEWSALGGFIVSGADSLYALINAPGLYDLEVTNTLNGCSAVDAVEIMLNGDLPEPCVEAFVQAPCGDASILVGDTCAAGMPYSYQWSVSGGGFIQGDSTLSMVEVFWEDSLVQVTGLIIDTTNLCPLAVNIEIFAPVNCFPECEVALPEVLTCDISSITLDASASSTGPEFVYVWNAISGNLCGGETTPFPCVDAPGVYRLTITDTTNQFTCTEDVLVLADTFPPPADAGPPAFLTCDSAEATLQGVPGPDLSYSWTAAGGPGCITSGAQSPAPAVSCPGIYYLEVTSALNGCTAVDSTEVLWDTIPPAAVIQIPDTLTCATSAVVISSQGSSLGSDITYQWSLNQTVLATGLGNWTATEPGWYCLTVIDENTGCTSQACDSLLQFTDPPTAWAGPDTVLTCGVASLTLSGSPGPGAGLEVLWATPDGCIQGDPVAQEVLIDCPGLYIYQVTDLATGCTGADTLAVGSLTTPPEAQVLLPDPITCLQSQVVLDGSGSQPAGNLLFSWSTGDGVLPGPVDASMALAAAGGSYQLVVQDPLTQCTDTAVVIVNSEVVIPAVSAGPDTLLTCLAPSIVLDGSGTATGLEYLYSWSPAPVAGGNTLFPLVDEPGVYVLTVLDTTNACSGSDTVVVGVDQNAPQAIIDLQSAPVITCVQQEVILSGQASSPAGSLDFFWFTPDGQLQGDPSAPEVAALEGGVYQLIVQDQQNGCLDTAFVSVGENVTPPQIVLQAPDTLTCIQFSVQLDASATSATGPLQVLWSGSGAIQDSLTLMPTVFQAGQYFVVVEDQSNGCLAQDSLWVLQDTLPPVALATALGVFDCETAAVVMSGTGSSVGPLFVYTWTGPPGAPISDAGALSPTVFEPGWYVLTVQNEQNGCISLDSAEAVSEGFPILGVELELTLPSCYGDRDGMIRIDSVSGGQGPFLYAFEDNGFFPFTQFRYLAAGTYAIVVEDDNGCRYDTLIYLDNPNELAVDLGPDIYIQLGEWATIEAIANVPASELELVQWHPSGDPECPECLVFEARPSFTTTFQILIRNERGCVASDEMTVFVEKETPVYFPNVFSPNGDGENDRFFAQSGPQVALVELLQIFDRWGNLVFEARGFQPNDPNFGWDGRFNDRLMNSQVFVWQCQIQLRDGSIETHFGDVLLAH